jgi:hypothetical protein
MALTFLRNDLYPTFPTPTVTDQQKADKVVYMNYFKHIPNNAN